MLFIVKLCKSILYNPIGIKIDPLLPPKTKCLRENVQDEVIADKNKMLGVINASYMGIGFIPILGNILNYNRPQFRL